MGVFVLGVADLIGPPQQCVCNAFSYDTFWDHLQTCQTKSAVSQVHDLVVYKLGTLLGSVGHRIKIYKITPATDKERGDIEIKDYVVLQKPQTQDNRLPPPHTLIMDYTMTHIRFGRSNLRPMGQLTNTRRSDGSPRWGSKGSGQNSNPTLSNLYSAFVLVRRHHGD